MVLYCTIERKQSRRDLPGTHHHHHQPRPQLLRPPATHSGVGGRRRGEGGGEQETLGRAGRRGKEVLSGPAIRMVATCSRRAGALQADRLRV
jgi:hypothetical protein